MANSVLTQSDALERLLLRQGVVAMVKADATAQEAALIRQTGVAFLVADAAIADSQITESSLDEVVDLIVESVQL